jgi:hypothetical protein
LPPTAGPPSFSPGAGVASVVQSLRLTACRDSCKNLFAAPPANKGLTCPDNSPNHSLAASPNRHPPAPAATPARAAPLAHPRRAFPYPQSSRFPHLLGLFLPLQPLPSPIRTCVPTRTFPGALPGAAPHPRAASRKSVYSLVHHGFPGNSYDDGSFDAIPPPPLTSGTTAGPATVRVRGVSGGATVALPWAAIHMGALP